MQRLLEVTENALNEGLLGAALVSAVVFAGIVVLVFV